MSEQATKWAAGRVPLLLTVALLLTAAGRHNGDSTSLGRTTGTPPAFSATTQLLGPNGELRGTAALTATNTGTRVVAQLEGLLPGPYAIDVHRIGRCDGAGFASVGDTIARSTTVIVGVNGSTTIDLTIDGRQFIGGNAPILGASGAAVVLEAAPRDGHGAAPIACGALAPRPPAA